MGGNSFNEIGLNQTMALNLLVHANYLYDEFQFMMSKSFVNVPKLNKENFTDSKLLKIAMQRGAKLFGHYDLEYVTIQENNPFAGDNAKERTFNFIVSEIYPADGGKYKFCKGMTGTGRAMLLNFAAAFYFLAIYFWNFEIFTEKICKQQGIKPWEVHRDLEHLRECIHSTASAALVFAMYEHKTSIDNSQRARKERICNGVTPEQRKERNEEIFRDFQKSRLDTSSSFSEQQKNQKKFSLSARQIRRIIDNHLAINQVSGQKSQ